MSIENIEQLAAEYSSRRKDLSVLVMEMQERIEAIRIKSLEAIRIAVANAAEAHDALFVAIQNAPGEFDKPKTRTLHGIRCGYMKQRGQVVFDNEPAVIKRIREQLPAMQAELLIRVSESVHKPAVYDLAVADLKRLGIRIEDDSDVVTIKPVDKEVDKLVDALLKSAQVSEGDNE